jgi:hypothetical protein
VGRRLSENLTANDRRRDDGLEITRILGLRNSVQSTTKMTTEVAAGHASHQTRISPTQIRIYGAVAERLKAAVC